MKTHKVIDLVYHEDEGNVAFVGTYEECQDWITNNYDVGYQVVPLSLDELKLNNEFPF